MEKKVVDISKYQVIKDYNTFAKSVDGVIIRAGYRGYSLGKITEDKLFATHLKNLYNKVPIGVYFFTTAINEKEAEEEAKWIINRLKGYSLSFPIIVDTEYSNKLHTGRSDKLSRSERTKVIVKFCETCKSLGFRPCIYASSNWLVANLNYKDISDYSIWVAKYSSEAPSNIKSYIGWQYIGNGAVNGYSSRIDVSHWYEDIDISKSKYTPSKVEVKNPETIKKDDNANTLKTGQEITLKDINLYVNSTTAKVASKKTGTFYIWSDIEKNGRIRITNKKDKVGNVAYVTGWVNKNDLLPKSSTTTTKPATSNNTSSSASTSSTKKYKTGDSIILNNTNIYSSSTTSTVVAKKTGTFYIWSDKVLRDRIRITNKKELVGDPKGVTGWIKIK